MDKIIIYPGLTGIDAPVVLDGGGYGQGDTDRDGEAV